MMDSAAEPYSYRRDAAVPDFADDRPLFIFDGVCVLCSSGVRWLIRRDPAGRFRFATAQSPLGRAIYSHYGIDMQETYLLLDEGRVYVRSDGYLHIAPSLGGFYRALAALARLVPRALRDAAYDLIARHRYRWFGKTDYCALIPPEMKERVLH